MQVDYNGNKGFRLLSIYERLNKGEVVNKSELARSYGVSEKTAQRDIDDIRAYLADMHQMETDAAVKYDRKRQGYYLVRGGKEWMTKEEVMAVSKILLESRAFETGEETLLIEKLLAQVSENDRKSVEKIIRSELNCYVPLHHGKKLLAILWELSLCVNAQKIIKIEYTRKDGIAKSHLVKPVAVMFSEYYFYLAAYLADDSKEYPTIFRADRIQKMEDTGEKFKVPYSKRFSEGEFRKRVQFMYSGELRKIKFEYSGPSVEAVLDRLPTAEIVSEKDGKYVIKAEVYGDGIEMWMRSQGKYIRILKGVDNEYKE